MAKMCTRCHRPAVKGRRVCEQHLTAAYYRPKRKPQPRFQAPTPRDQQIWRHPLWPQRRREYLDEHPWCERCERMGKPYRPAEVVDHIWPVRLLRERELDPANYQALCARCHNVKTGHERGGLLYDWRNGRIVRLGG